tara:strand:+ start:3685 stop:3963 length:279 start_codon:yes stop_codon:yes gene_type:complete
MKFNLKELVNSSRGRTVFSILLGLGLATLFRKACNNRNCLVFKAPSLQNIKGKVFGHNDKCYSYEETGVTCPDNNNEYGELKDGNVVLEIDN